MQRAKFLIEQRFIAEQEMVPNIMYEPLRSRSREQVPTRRNDLESGVPSAANLENLQRRSSEAPADSRVRQVQGMLASLPSIIGTMPGRLAAATTSMGPRIPGLFSRRSETLLPVVQPHHRPSAQAESSKGVSKSDVFRAMEKGDAGDDMTALPGPSLMARTGELMGTIGQRVKTTAQAAWNAPLEKKVKVAAGVGMAAGVGDVIQSYVTAGSVSGQGLVLANFGLGMLGLTYMNEWERQDAEATATAQAAFRRDIEAQGLPFGAMFDDSASESDERPPTTAPEMREMPFSGATDKSQGSSSKT